MHIVKQQETPDWLIDAIDGAREAFDAWKSAEDAEEPLRKAERDAIRAQQGTSRWEGTPASRFMAPALGVTTADFETARAAVTEATIAVRASQQRTAAAKRRFEGLIRNGGDPDRRNRIAASVALAKHEEAAAAWAVLVEALDTRDLAYLRAGSPGQAWQGVGFSADSQAHAQVDHAVQILSRRVQNFDVDAVTAITEEV